MKPRIYTDTSVIGGCFDEEFARWSNALVDQFRSGVKIPIVSEIVAAEIRDAPPAVCALFDELLLIAPTPLPVTAHAERLAEAYESRGIIASRFRWDMLHIALATLARVDAVVSWNFKHIVQSDKVRVFNEVNADLGHAELRIVSPRLMLIEENRHETS